MTTISKEKIFKRWDTLPDNLREILISEETGALLWQTCESEHLVDEKIRVVARLVGYVLFGFLHPEDLTKEIQDSLGLNPQVAATISGALNKKIFVPLRPDIDKVYAPVAMGITQPSERPVTTSIPMFSRPSSPLPPTSSSPSSSLIDLSPPSTRSGQAAAGPSAPSPFILHQELEVKPEMQKPGFKLDIPLSKFEEVKNVELAPQAARLEIGPHAGETPYNTVLKTETEKPKVVNYGEINPIGTPIFGGSSPASLPPISPASASRGKSPFWGPPAPGATPLVNTPGPPSPAGPPPPKNMPAIPSSSIKTSEVKVVQGGVTGDPNSFLNKILGGSPPAGEKPPPKPPEVSEIKKPPPPPSPTTPTMPQTGREPAKNSNDQEVIDLSSLQKVKAPPKTPSALDTQGGSSLSPNSIDLKNGPPQSPIAN